MPATPGSVLLGGVRTPIGRLLGGLAPLTSSQLGGLAVSAALERTGVRGADVDAVLFGNVVQAGGGPNPARQAAVLGGIPMSVPATTVNALCLSGLTALALADQYVRSGAADVLVVGGTESMTNAPHLLMSARQGFRYGPAGVPDALDRDALICVFDQESMGAATDRYQTPLGITRAEQDEWSARSHTRAAAAQKDGRLAEEIVPVTVPGRRGDVVVEADEGIRPGTTVESLSRLRPAFAPSGTVTAGSSSQLSDGACALVVMSRERAEAEGRSWLAEIDGCAQTSGPDPSLLSQPATAARAALARSSAGPDAVPDLYEINEAFAGVAIQSVRELGADPDRVNVNGGAIALGHPVGMSGARLALTLGLELRRRGGGLGVAALCGGGGQGQAAVLRVPAAG